MQKLLVAFLLLLFLTHSNLATAQSAPLLAQEGPVRLAPKPALEGPVSQVEGSWRLTPLILKGAPAPETNGQFQEFGETYVMENMLVFWARFGPADKDWGLFSLKDGKLSKVLLADVEFVAPDSRKIKVSRAGLFPARISAGKRILYISNLNPDHVYGWDGERLVRVLCAGDQVEASGVRYTVKRATVLDVGPDGRALMYYDANEPRHINGWVLHDGTSFTPVLKEGDPLPGMPGAQIKYLGSARLLEDGSILAILEVTGAAYKRALFHIARDKTETIIDQELVWRASQFWSKRPGRPLVARLGKVLVARSDSFVMDLKVYAGPGGQWVRVDGSLCPPDIPLFYYRGKFEADPCPHLETWSSEGAVGLDHAIFLAPGSPRVVFTVATVSSPSLYFWDGGQLSAVPWEEALGMDGPGALKAMETKRGSMIGRALLRPVEVEVKEIRLRRIAGPVSGVGVLLPLSGSAGARWFIPSDSVTGKLERGPQFQVPGRTVTVADVLAWRTPEEALVELEDGYYLLTKAADLK